MTGSGGHVHNACQASLAELQYMSVRPKTNLEMHVSTIHFKQVWIVYILLFCRHVYRYHIELTFFKTGLRNMALTMSNSCLLYICQQHLVVYFLKLASMKIRNFSVQQVCGVLISR